MEMEKEEINEETIEHLDKVVEVFEENNNIISKIIINKKNFL